MINHKIIKLIFKVNFLSLSYRPSKDHMPISILYSFFFFLQYSFIFSLCLFFLSSVHFEPGFFSLLPWTPSIFNTFARKTSPSIASSACILFFWTSLIQLDAVSYTHLDVYKRQVNFLPNLLFVKNLQFVQFIIIHNNKKIIRITNVFIYILSYSYYLSGKIVLQQTIL